MFPFLVVRHKHISHEDIAGSRAGAYLPTSYVYMHASCYNGYTVMYTPIVCIKIMHVLLTEMPPTHIPWRMTNCHMLYRSTRIIVIVYAKYTTSVFIVPVLDQFSSGLIPHITVAHCKVCMHDNTFCNDILHMTYYCTCSTQW